MNVTRFSCNEIYAKPDESVRGANVFLFQTSTDDVNEDYMEYHDRALKRSCERGPCDHSTLVARQDRGEPANPSVQK
jgi:phosphoribosylpyrophosphate synthetase